MRSTLLARTLQLAGVFCGLCDLTGCEAVFGDFNKSNPQNCVSTPGLCTASEICSPVTQLCEPKTSELPDLATMSWKVVPSGTTNELFGVWGSDTNNVWAVGKNGTLLKWDRASSRNC